MGIIRQGVNLLVNQARFESRQALFWSPYYPSNFGELVGPFLYERIAGVAPWFRAPSHLSRSSVYMSAGSIMGLAEENCIVWGSGILYRDQQFFRPWRTLAVRGPRTRDAYHRLGFRCPEVYGDPAIVLPLVYHPAAPPVRYPVGLIPHFRDLPQLRERLCVDDGLLLIDVRHPIEDIVDQIRQCARIVSSSLHGIIVAHAYGVPAQWVLWGHESGDGVKYQDYFESLGERGMKVIDCRSSGSITGKLAIAWASDAPLLSSHELAQGLLASCPFPKPVIQTHNRHLPASR